MNDFFRGKIQACLELCGGDANLFRSYVMTTTGLTSSGFTQLNMTKTAFEMLQRGDNVNDVIDAVM